MCVSVCNMNIRFIQRRDLLVRNKAERINFKMFSSPSMVPAYSLPLSCLCWARED